MHLTKCAVLTGMLALALGIGAGGAHAQQKAPASDEVKVTLGMKLWLNKWETGYVFDDPFTGNANVDVTSKFKVSAIPNVSVGYRDFFVSAGYFVKRNYNFPSFTLADTVQTGLNKYETSAKRSEWDLNLGYWLLQGDQGSRLGVTLGYKQVNQYYKTACCSNPFYIQDSDSSTTKNKGVTVGLTGSAHIAGNWYVYGSGATGPMKANFSGGNSDKGYYVSGEMGVVYPFGQGTSISAGYKAQLIDIDFGSQRGRDTTNGFILGVSHTF